MMIKQDLYEAIFQTTASAVIVLDPDGRIVMFNPACERISGYRFEEVRSRVFWDFLLMPGEKDLVRNTFESLRTGNFPNAGRNHWVTKTGGLRLIEWSNSAISDASGKVTHIIGTGIDITEKTDAEERLTEITATIPLALWIMDLPSNRVSYVSPGYEKIWGHSPPPPGSAAKFFHDSVHPEDREHLFQQLAKESRVGIAGDSTFRIIKPDGNVRWIRSRSFPMRDADGGIVRVIGYAEDATGQQLANQTLEDFRNRQSAILNAISDSVYLKDANLRYIEVNRGFLERHGLKQDGVIGRTAHDIFPENAAAIEARDRQVLHSGSPLRSEVIRTVAGEQRWYDVIRHPVIDNTGRVTGIAASSRDITGRKLAETRRSERETTLRQALIKEVHHRIKNNLQGAISLLDQLALKYPDFDEPLASLRTRLNTIALVHGLQNSIPGHEMNFCNVTTAIIAAVRALHGEDALSIAFEEGFQAIELDDDEAVPMALIVNELISNALKHAAQDAPRPIAHVQLQRRPFAVKLHIRNFTGSLPGSFDFQGSIGLGTGLRLLKSLLPPAGATLEINNCPAGGVEAIFTLTPPIVRENNTDNAKQPQ